MSLPDWRGLPHGESGHILQGLACREARAKQRGTGVLSLLRQAPDALPGEACAELPAFPGYAAGLAWEGTAPPEPPRLLTAEELLHCLDI